MIDPACFICTPSLCVHGEQSPSQEDVERDLLRREILKIAGERDELAALLKVTRSALRRAWGLANGEITGKKRGPKPKVAP